jgi:uncharacterized protein with von Willebrand factor type A (vWA) domain
VQHKTIEILPLYHFFEKLRQNDFSLGMGDYERFLFALEQHFGLTPSGYQILLSIFHQRSSLKELQASLSKERLLNFCKLLWLKPNQSIRAFEDMFEDALLLDFQTLNKGQNTNLEERAPETPVSKDSNTAEPSLHKPDNKRTEEDREQTIESTSNETISPDENVTVRVAVSENKSYNELKLKQDGESDIENSKFLFAQHYFPIDKRKIQQNLRQFPVLQNIHATNEMDIHATINKAIDRGFFGEIVWKKQKANNINLLLFIDHLGSMIAFEQLSNILKTELGKILTPGREPKDNALAMFYFYNCVYDKLYTNKTHTKSKSLDSILDRSKSKSTSIIIFSDAGSARGNYNLNRIRSTKEFLGKLYKHTRKIIWLNPLPRERWLNNSVETIAEYVTMYEANESGIKNAVDFLKGTSIKLNKTV